MARKLQTIYEYFSEYSEEEVDYAISKLAEEERELIYDRYGTDLHNPVKTGRWNTSKSKKFYNKVTPKMRRILQSKEYFIKDDLEETKETTDVVTSEEDKETKIEVEPKIVLGGSITVEILKLVKEGKSNKEICDTLGIESKVLYQELLNLKNQGLFLTRKYHSDGRINYRGINTMPELRNLRGLNQDRILFTFNNEDNLRILVISDLHLGNKEQRLDLLDRAFNYCIKNGIHTIFCGGDMVDGAYTKGEQFITDPYAQLEYFTENYPQDNSIITLGVAGDHDLSVFSQSGIDMIEFLNNYRHDVIIGGYNNSSIMIKNDKVHLFHHVDGGALRKTDAPIIIHGHSHKYCTSMLNSTLNLTAPTLSDIAQLMPTAVDMELCFEKGYISKSILKQIYFGSDDIVLNESTFDHSKRSLPIIPIKYEEVPFSIEEDKKEETSLKEDTLVLGKTLKQGNLSQIDKFYKRYKNI